MTLTKKLMGVVISDLHIGSAFAIFPQGFTGSTGSEIVLIGDGDIHKGANESNNIPRKAS